jgi:hypothetical protein
MDGAVAPPPRQVTQWRWLALTILLGFAGALSALIGFGKGTYSMGPIVVELSVRPSTSGTTELAVVPVPGLKPGHAEANTHSGFLAIRGTVVDVHGTALLPDALRLTKDPRTLASYVKDEAREAGRRFAIKVGLMALAGGAGGGAIVGLIGLRPRRLIEGAIAGVLLVGLLGFIAYQTYNVDAFRNVTFKPGLSATASDR